MAEWSKALAWKASEGVKPSAGSNPALSAVIENVRYSWRFLLHTEGAGMRSKVLGAKRAVNPALSAVIENVRYSWRFLLHAEGAGMRSKVLGAKRAVNPADLRLSNL